MDTNSHYGHLSVRDGRSLRLQNFLVKPVGDASPMVDPCLETEHINAISVEAGRRLHYLKLLQRSSVACDGLLYYYKSIIRPVFEYACPSLAIWAHC
jgi:hypothetical protein